MKPLISNRIIYVVFLFFMQTNLIYAMEENAQIKTLFEAADVNATFFPTLPYHIQLWCLFAGHKE